MWGSLLLICVLDLPTNSSSLELRNPQVALWHWTVPLWFDDLGGFENGDINKYFVRFAVDMYKEFGKDVKWWILLNEPTVRMYA